jgi:hypothetical protein
MGDGCHPLVSGLAAGRNGGFVASEKIQPDEVVPGHQNHETENSRQPKPKSHILSANAKRPAQNSFESIIQKVPTVEQRDGKKIDESNTYGH